MEYPQEASTRDPHEKTGSESKLDPESLKQVDPGFDPMGAREEVKETRLSLTFVSLESFLTWTLLLLITQMTLALAVTFSSPALTLPFGILGIVMLLGTLAVTAFTEAQTWPKILHMFILIAQIAGFGLLAAWL